MEKNKYFIWQEVFMFSVFNGKISISTMLVESINRDWYCLQKKWENYRPNWIKEENIYESLEELASVINIDIYNAIYDVNPDEAERLWLVND